MQTIVGVLRGGPGREHDVSLATGAALVGALPEARYDIHDIYIDREGAWHDRGRLTTPDRALQQLDTALIGLHGDNGEVQKLLERFGVSYAGTDSFGTSLAAHKLMAKMRAQEAGLMVPACALVERPEDAERVTLEITRTFHQPVMVKPIDWGSSAGVSVVGGHAAVLAAIEGLFAAGARNVLVEEYVRGREASMIAVEGLRGEPLYTAFPIEIKHESDHFSHDIKMAGTARVSCPGAFSRVDAEELGRLTRLMHRELGLRHYSKSDFIVTPRGIYYLETDAFPALGRRSLFSRALEAVGVSLRDFGEHLVNLARA